ncbi:hypothetical protein BDZ89DRAFT_1079767 [Hymenopellis radicata]|nr:hypothetical protein BDZ89DRAFT_1079767 [Hymenopellis radicata]
MRASGASSFNKLINTPGRPGPIKVSQPPAHELSHIWRIRRTRVRHTLHRPVIQPAHTLIIACLMKSSTVDTDMPVPSSGA